MQSAAPTVFLVEDEASIAEAVVFALQAEGYRCRHFANGHDCVTELKSDDTRADGGTRPNLILLDIGLPDGNGFEFFRRIREVSGAPVVFLTARAEEIDRVAGLEMGADDYVVKPFSLRELMARVRMVMRRSEPVVAPTADNETRDSSLVCTGPFTHDESRREISYHNQVLTLTLHEYHLLEALLKHPGRVLSRSQLLEQAWDAPDHRLERTVDTHIKSLRAKLREINATTDLIRTHRGLGYSLDLDSFRKTAPTTTE
ncbi:MAG: two-component system response regulator CreB [Gammaproteobacteria bacterium]